MPEPVVQLTDLSKRFGTKTAVDHVSLTVEPGEIFGFLGPNGAGKTTTIRLLMDFIRPTSGAAKIFGRDVRTDVSARKRIGYLSSEYSLYDNWTAKDHFRFLTNIRGVRGDGGKLAEQLDLDLRTKVRQLSSGNKQKVALVLALMHEPELLILDEPTRGLDPLLQQETLGLLVDFKKRGGTVFMSSHNLAEVQQICDRVGIIREGKLIASETMTGLRSMHVHTVSAVFAGPYTPEDLRESNVDVVRQTERDLVVTVTGDLNPFLRKLTRHELRDLEISHLSLEDVFMRYYRD